MTILRLLVQNRMECPLNYSQGYVLSFKVMLEVWSASHSDVATCHLVYDCYKISVKE